LSNSNEEEADATAHFNGIIRKKIKKQKINSEEVNHDDDGKSF
jgi:hypothetical protein